MEGRKCSCTHKLTGEMSGTHVLRALCACAILCAIINNCTATVIHDNQPTKNNDGLEAKKIELFDGVTVNFPKDSNQTRKMFSLELDTNRRVEGRGKQKKLMQRILPLFIMPFLIQSTIVPFFLSMLKFMLFKSMMVGKLALALIFFNAFRNHNAVKGRHDEVMADVHYGYHGNMEEYGAYVN